MAAVRSAFSRPSRAALADLMWAEASKRAAQKPVNGSSFGGFSLIFLRVVVMPGMTCLSLKCGFAAFDFLCSAAMVSLCLGDDARMSAQAVRVE